jgi:hypothetical protein
VRIECAARHDLATVPIVQISKSYGWQDHADHAGRRGGASSAKRAVRDGREILHDLGAWPWAHAERGRLYDHPEWWREEAFLGPLREWIGFGWARLIFNEVQRHKRALALEDRDDAAEISVAAWAILEEFAAQTAIALDADRFVRSTQEKEDGEPQATDRQIDTPRG